MTTMTTMTDYASLTDAALTQRLGGALLDRSPELPALEQERQRRLAATAHQRIASVEAQRRQIAADAAERDALLARLLAQRDDLRACFVAALQTLSVTAPADVGPLLASAYQLGRQAYALGHDLAGVTGDRRLAGRYDVTDQLALHGGAAGAAFVASLRGHVPAVPTPWRADVERLRALTPRVQRVGNGG